jgi:pyruvate/2-oxoglutarate dehydrogenase complex dihydrolipoamide dehydrogenase (E3) component
MGKYHARIAADVILGRDARLDEHSGGPLSPRVVFTDPQVAAVGELIHAATIAVVGEVPIARLWHAVPSYPTISEVWLRLLENYRG